MTLPNINFKANYIHLSENRLENLADLYHLLQVSQLQTHFKSNRLFSCNPNHTPPGNHNLKHLLLGENMLQLAWETGFCWDVFKGLSHLQVLYLNNNYPNFLPPGVFSDLTSLRGLNSNRLPVLSPGSLPASLEVLDISRNHLLSPDPGVFASLNFLDITHNEFTCECELSTFISWLNQTNVTLLGSPADINCMCPNSLLGVSLYSISMEDCDEEEVLKSLKFPFLSYSLSL